MIRCSSHFWKKCIWHHKIVRYCNVYFPFLLWLQISKSMSSMDPLSVISTSFNVCIEVSPYNDYFTTWQLLHHFMQLLGHTCSLVGLHCPALISWPCHEVEGISIKLQRLISNLTDFYPTFQIPFLSYIKFIIYVTLLSIKLLHFLSKFAVAVVLLYLYFFIII